MSSDPFDPESGIGLPDASDLSLARLADQMREMERALSDQAREFASLVHHRDEIKMLAIGLGWRLRAAVKFLPSEDERSQARHILARARKLLGDESGFLLTNPEDE